MSGALVVGTVLRGVAVVTAKVPAEKIMSGRLPDGIAPPALLVRNVSMIERQPLKRAGWVRQTWRVAVTVRAGSYRDQTAIMRVVNAVCPGVKGEVGNDAKRVSILAAGIGPDVAGPGDTYEQTHDFRVSFDAPVNATQAGA